MKRLVLIFLLVSLIAALPFVTWGAEFESAMGGDAGIELLRSWGSLAWLAALLLLAGDILLPVPATAVMGALGIVYGPVLGGAIGTLGSCFSGLLGYWLCKKFGRPVAVRIAGEKELERAEAFFGRSGGVAVALSRWMPVLPEAIACMAGIARMRPWRFVAALASGSAPMAFVYATLGSRMADPWLAMVLCALIPVPLWLLIGRHTVEMLSRLSDSDSLDQ
jgi:uncharacterized membrane protein YdjX (TVP38/TMEM64 family)